MAGRRIGRRRPGRRHGMGEQKDMHGVLFKNDRPKRPGKDDPHLRGSCTIDGRRFYLSAWSHTVRAAERQGERYLSIVFRAAEDGRERTPQPPVADSDDWPF
jgi:hypothetical protein